MGTQQGSWGLDTRRLPFTQQVSSERPLCRASREVWASQGDWAVCPHGAPGRGGGHPDRPGSTQGAGGDERWSEPPEVRCPRARGPAVSALCLGRNGWHLGFAPLPRTPSCGLSCGCLLTRLHPGNCRNLTPRTAEGQGAVPPPSPPEGSAGAGDSTSPRRFLGTQRPGCLACPSGRLPPPWRPPGAGKAVSRKRVGRRCCLKGHRRFLRGRGHSSAQPGQGGEGPSP